MMRRRALLIAFGAGAVAAPLAALGQRQPAKIPRVAYVSGRDGPPDPSADAVRQGLRGLGYVEGKNILFEPHYFGRRMDSVPGGVAELVQKVDVVVSATTPIILAAKQATKTVPIVVVLAGDPIAIGLVASLARPGGNITGISRLHRELTGKRLELLNEILPARARMAVLWDGDDKVAAQGYRDYVAAARSLQVEVISLELRGAEPDLVGAFQAAVKSHARGLITIRGTRLLGHSQRIAELAIKHRLPSMYEGIEFVEAGGLISYASNDYESFKRAAVFVDKILKGARPGELPMEQPTQFELVVNMKTAKAIGFAISKDFLLRADRVIE